MQTDKFVAVVAVGLVVATGLAAALLAQRQEPGDAVVAGAGQRNATGNPQDVVTAPPLKAPAAWTQFGGKSGPSTAHSMGAAPACPNCGVVQRVVAVYGYGERRAEAYQMHIRMDDGTHRTMQQRGALAAGSRVLIEGDKVRVLAERAAPG